MRFQNHTNMTYSQKQCPQVFPWLEIAQTAPRRWWEMQEWWPVDLKMYGMREMLTTLPLDRHKCKVFNIGNACRLAFASNLSISQCYLQWYVYKFVPGLSFVETAAYSLIVEIFHRKSLFRKLIGNTTWVTASLRNIMILILTLQPAGSYNNNL